MITTCSTVPAACPVGQGKGDKECWDLELSGSFGQMSDWNLENFLKA
jgi:hypothetical protein